MRKRCLALARTVELNPWDRYAFVGKSRSGKTVGATILATSIISYDRNLANGWEAWWIDTKNDRRDIARLKQWGFEFYNPLAGRGIIRRDKSARKLIVVPFERGKPKSTVDRVNEICYKALDQHGVLLIIDEYRHVVPTTRTASPGILHVHQRGAGRDVGVIGCTQEPVEIPRQLLSQAAHIFLFDLTYPYDIKYAKTLFPRYKPPREQGNRHGFYHGWIDGDGEWAYYPHIKAWKLSQQGVLVPA